MNFFEQELRNIVGDICPTATYVGRACYVELTELNRAKIQFVSTHSYDHYNAIQATIVNRNEGQIDCIHLNFADIWGRKRVNNPNFRDGLIPHAWTYNGDTSWYVYQPTHEDYKKLQGSLLEYLKVFDYLKDRKPSLDAKITDSASKSGQMNGVSGRNEMEGPGGR